MSEAANENVNDLPLTEMEIPEVLRVSLETLTESLLQQQVLIEHIRLYMSNNNL